MCRGCRGCRVQFTQGGAKSALVSKIWGKQGRGNFYNTVFAIIKGDAGGCRALQIAVYAGGAKCALVSPLMEELEGRR